MCAGVWAPYEKAIIWIVIAYAIIGKILGNRAIILDNMWISANIETLLFSPL